MQMQYQIQNIIFDAETGICAVDNSNSPNEVKLEGLNLLLMRALTEFGSEPLTIDVLSKIVWKRDHVSEDTIAKRISLLRATLSEIAGSTQVIRTLPNRRYQLIGPIKKLEVSEVPPTPLATKHANKKSFIIAVAVILILITTAVYQMTSTKPPVLKDPETGKELIAPNS
ncbi:hypothetical protein [Kordiimonas sp. SCSIO 12610]|uniref:winged helix-turn-helix domain-containing protein n=1 Tax=Kordiimonas sp. SCSIO 12610 TaxID=2829597 RepID=UPI00210C92D3|nr:hypothetical protein [Kordiimonas sp. SCSIO 12610]UTW55693.1 hypothetical protein KFF44_02030 [Kordiimonas sp. SCSIO 12610]